MTLRSAELGFFGVTVRTWRQTPRLCGQASRSRTLLLALGERRGLRTSWLIVGIRGLESEEKRVDECSSKPTCEQPERSGRLLAKTRDSLRFSQSRENARLSRDLVQLRRRVFSCGPGLIGQHQDRDHPVAVSRRLSVRSGGRMPRISSSIWWRPGSSSGAGKSSGVDLGARVPTAAVEVARPHFPFVHHAHVPPTD